VIIFIFSSIPNISKHIHIHISDKILHGLEYLILGWLTARAFQSPQRSYHFWSFWLLTCLVVVAIGGLDELYQGTVTLRFSDWQDWLADGIGGALGGILYLVGHRIKYR
jgi:VanZ family protein